MGGVMEEGLATDRLDFRRHGLYTRLQRARELGTWQIIAIGWSQSRR